MTKTLTVDQARVEVERLHKAELHWAAVQREKGTLLQQFEEAAGGIALELDEASALETSRAAALERQALRADIEVCRQTSDAARTARREALAGLFAAEAAVLRGQAKALRREADEREPLTVSLLQELEKHEGILYEVPPPRPQRVGSFDVITRPVPRTQALRNEADRLDGRVREVVNTQVVGSGSVTGSADQVAAAATSDPLKIGPRIADILAWIEQARAKEIARRERIALHGVLVDTYVPLDAPVVYELVWRDGAIDPSSRVVVAPPRGAAPPAGDWSRLRRNIVLS